MVWADRTNPPQLLARTGGKSVNSPGRVGVFRRMRLFCQNKHRILAGPIELLALLYPPDLRTLRCRGLGTGVLQLI